MSGVFEEQIKIIEITFRTLDRNKTPIKSILKTKIAKNTLIVEIDNNHLTVPHYIVEQVKSINVDLSESEIESVLKLYAFSRDEINPFTVLGLVIVSVILSFFVLIVLEASKPIFEEYELILVGIMIILLIFLLIIWSKDEGFRRDITSFFSKNKKSQIKTEIKPYDLDEEEESLELDL